MTARVTLKIQPSGNIVGFVDDNVECISTKHPKYAELRKAYEAGDAEEFVRIYKEEVMDFHTTEKYEIEDKIEIKEESIEYRGRTITDPNLISVIKNYNTSCDALKRFVDNIFLNPRPESVEQLARFLKHNNLPLTESGEFIGYKAVDDDLYDLHSHTIYNGIGQVVKMPRADVTFDPERACSAGLHVGTYSYARDYGGSRGVLLLVKVNPAHVVSVPFDCDSQKLRTSQYTVLALCESTLDTSNIYTVDGKEHNIANYFADIKEEDYRRRRPSVIISSYEEDDDEYSDYDEDEDDDILYYYCDNCDWECECSEAEDAVGQRLNWCSCCGNELSVR